MMKVLFAMMIGSLFLSQTPSVLAEVESIDLNLKQDEMALTFFSLSDGEAALLQHPNGENILINTGGENTRKELDYFLRLFGVKNISAIIMTMDDQCCNQNLDWLVKQFGVRKIFTGTAYADHIKKHLRNRIEIQTLSKGMKEQIVPDVLSEILHENEQGMDFSIKFFEHRIFFMNSTGDHVEKSLLKQQLSDANIVKIPEFGRENSISKSLIQHMDPQMAVIFHSKTIKPSPDLFELLNDAWIDVYYTKNHGTITIKFTNLHYETIKINDESDEK
jgi:competence protein ComEC